MNKRIYVGNLNYDVTSEQLKEYFSEAGEVVEANVITYRDSGRSKGFGFVEMATEEDAQTAIDKFDKVEHKGRTLHVEEASPKPERDDTESEEVVTAEEPSVSTEETEEETEADTASDETDDSDEAQTLR